MKALKKVLVLLLFSVFMISISGCKKDVEEDGYTYNEYLGVSPSNWNELTYQDANDTEILDYISSPFFEYNYKFDKDGQILDGEYTVEYSAATKLEDVTANYAGDLKYSVPSSATKGYAYKITLRDNLKWDDGTKITAEDFVYSMQQQLDPLFKNYRADTFYIGSIVIHNARQYVNQGDSVYESVCTVASDPTAVSLQISDLVKGTDGVYKQKNGKDVVFVTKEPLVYLGGNKLEKYKDDLSLTAWNQLQELANEKGRIPVTDQSIELFKTLINTESWGNEGPECLPCYLYSENIYGKMDFEDVGIFVGDNDLELVIVLDNPLVLLNDDGSLSYKAAYNMSNLPLVHRKKYEASKTKPVQGSTLWTSKYNSSVSTTASWGPYKLTQFQTGKSFTLEKNENWYGYKLEQYEGQYQTDSIKCQIVEEYETALMMFLKGELDYIDVSPEVAPDYKNSERATYTPTDYVGSLQIQSSKEALKAREKAGINKTILTYPDFRKALSLGFNRTDYANKCTTSSLAGFGLFNSMHYYDVANGGKYRNTTVAKEVLCDVYGIDRSKFETLDDAVDSITGYDLKQARELVTKAYNEALANGDIKSNDIVKITFGTGASTTTIMNRFEYIKNAWTELVKTTPLENRLEMDFVDKGDSWGTDFRAGAYDVCMGGWTGAAWDPGYFLYAYIGPEYMFSTAWETDKAMLTFTMPGVGENNSDVTDTLSLIDWYNCLNGNNNPKYNWAEGMISQEKRVLLIAAIEKEILQAYYTIPVVYDFSCSLLSYKCDYKTLDYNTFMHYGGIRYLKYNLTNSEFKAKVKEAGGQLNYKA